MTQQRTPGKTIVQLGETPLEANRRIAQGKASPGEQDWLSQLQKMRGQQAKVQHTNPVAAPSIDLGKPADRQIVQTSSPTDTVSPEMLREQFQSGDMPMGMGAAFHVVQRQFKQGARQPVQAQAAEVATTTGPTIQPDMPNTPGAPSMEEVVAQYAAVSAGGTTPPAAAPAAQPGGVEEKENKVDQDRKDEDIIRTIDEAFGAIELTDAEKKLPDFELRKRMHAKHRIALDDESADPTLRANVMYGSAERRYLIDRRCAPVSIDEMLLSGTCKQTVPINPDTGFEVDFRTLHTGEDTFITTKLAAAAAQSSRMEFQQYVSRYELAFGLVRVKGVSYTDPTDIGEDGSVRVNDDKLAKKLNEVDRIPSPLFLELYTQYQWFKQRVRNAIALFDLGNG